MKNRKIIGKSLFLLTLACVAAFGLSARSGDAAFRPCGFGIECLDVWNPVICPNGQVYSNACYARKACQTGCVAY